ncbi:MAG: Dabb family protein [Phycisphaerae bacterium]
MGIPAGTSRHIVDNNYDYQCVVTFHDATAHEAYQSPQDQAHRRFVEQFKPFWRRVLIYDSVPAP